MGLELMNIRTMAVYIQAAWPVGRQRNLTLNKLEFRVERDMQRRPGVRQWSAPFAASV